MLDLETFCSVCCLRHCRWLLQSKDAKPLKAWLGNSLCGGGGGVGGGGGSSGNGGGGGSGGGGSRKLARGCYWLNSSCLPFK